MADNVESRIDLNIDVSNALASIKTLQAQISAFHQSIRNSGNAVNQAVSDNLTKNLLNSINATQKFSASLTTVSDSSQSFTNALEKNKLSMGEYFKYAGGASKTFGRLFRNEFNTIEKVARERVKSLQTQYIRMGRDANGALEAIKVRPLRLEMEQLGTQVAMTAQKQQLFNQLIKQGSTNLLNFGKNTQWAGRQLMVGFTIPLSIMGTMAIKEFEKIEKQAIRFKRVYGDAFSTDAETDAALANIRKLATEFTKYGIEVEKTLELAADAAQMGLKGSALNAQVTEATRLAVLGEVEQQEALEATISVTNAFGVAAEDLAGKINFLNAVENETLTSISDLTVAIPKAGPVIKQLGGSVEDLAFFLTAMREGGINASEGANALKSALSKIINPTEKASEMLAGFGINITSIVENNAGDIKNTILELGAAFDRLDPLNRSRAIEQLFGTFQFARISSLFANITKQGGQAQKVLELSRASSAELQVLAERELKRVEDSPIFKFEKAIERLQESLAPLGAEFIKIITPLIEFGTKILKSFNEMDEGAKAFVTNVVTVLGLIAPVAIMTFGLIANGVANFIKGVSLVGGLLGKVAGAGTGLNQMTQYMTQEQLEATAAASSLGQAHSMLTTTFTSEKVALDGLVTSYRNAISAINQYNVSSQSRVRPGASPTQTKKYASGVLSVPGPKGKGDIVPAMLSPGEAVIPADQANKYRGFIQQMISGSIPGFSRGVMLGMPRSSQAVAKDTANAQAIFESFKKSKYANVPPTEYGHQLAKTSGHSFPLFGVGGVYLSPSGKKVFVKPVIDEAAAMAEMRGTQIARQAHGLKAPQQRVVVMRDPYDTKRQRRFLALESDLDATFVNNDPKSVFNEEQYFKQLVASLVRVDKDLSASNIFGDVVADVGPAGVFSRASGIRDYTADLPSMEQQAMINLLGVKGGAKRAFAESTLGLMAGMSPQQYHQKMITEIQKVLPSLRQTIAGFGLTDQKEIDAYTGMVRRLEQGLSVDWSKFHAIHSGVKVTAPKTRQTDTQIRGYADGVVSVPGPKGKGDVIPAMLSPGEAVIPAKKARKYSGLIQQMISGNIPGFSKGKFEETHAAMPLPKTEGVLREVDKLEPGFSRLSKSVQDAFIVLSDLTVTKTERLNQAARGKGLSSQEFSEEWNQNSGEGFQKVAGRSQAAGQLGSSPEINTAVKSLDVQVGQAIAARIDDGDIDKSIIGWLDNLIAEVTQQIVQKFAASQSSAEREVAEAMAARASTPASLRTVSVQNIENPQTQQPYGSADAYFRGLINSGEAELRPTSGRDQVFVKDSEFSMPIGRTSSRGTLRTNSASPNRYAGKVLGGTYENPKALPKTDNLAGPVGDLASEYLVEAKDVGSQAAKNLVVGMKQGADEEGRMASPSREMYERGKNLVRGMLDGVQDGYRESTGQTLPPSGGPSLTPPPIPGFEQQAKTPQPPSDLDKGRALGKNLFNKVERAAEKALLEGPLGRTKYGSMLKDTFIANAAADAKAAAGGGPVTLTDSQGNVIYSEAVRQETQLQASKRALLEQQKLVQSIDQSQINQEQILLDEERVNLYNEDGTLKTRKQLIEEEEALRKRQDASAKSQEAENKRTKRQAAAQNRQARASKALGVLGTATMVAGMASGIEGKVGEIAQQALPALAGLSAIAPILLALPGPLALLAGVVGAVAFGFYKYNEELKKVREENRKLGESMAAGTKSLERLAEAAGTVTPTQAMNVARSGLSEQVTRVAGKTSFGVSFFGSDAGKEMLDEFNKVSEVFGKSKAVESIRQQLATAVASGVLDTQQAGSIALELGNKINDFGVSIDIAAELTELFGPNGEKLLSGDPLQIATELSERSIKNFTGNIQDAANALSGEGGWLRTFLGLDEEAIAAYAGGALKGFLEEQQTALDTLDAGSQKRIENLQKEAAALKAQGKDASEVYAKIDAERESLYTNRQKLIDEFQSNFDAAIIATETTKVGKADIDKLKQRATEEIDTEIQNRSPQATPLEEGEREQLIKDRYEKLLNEFNPEYHLQEKIYEGFVTGLKDATESEELKSAIDKVSDMDIEIGAKIMINSVMSTGDLDINTIGKLFEGFDFAGDGSAQFYFEMIGDIILEGGGRTAAKQLDAILGGVANTYDNPQDVAMASIRILEAVEGLEGIDLTKTLDQLTFFSSFISLFDGADPITEYLKLSQEEKDDMAERIAMMQDLVDASPDEPLTVEQVIEQKIITDTAMAAAFKEDAEFFEKLDPVQQFLYVQRFIAISSVVTDEQAVARLVTQGVTPAEGSTINFDPSARGRGRISSTPNFSDAQIEQAKLDIVKETIGIEDLLSSLGEETTPTSGESQKSDPFANILSQLKLLRNAAINAKGGVTELLRVLGDSAKEMKTFRGVSQKLLAEGFSREFIDSVMSMDEESRKNFISIENGIITVTEAGRALSRAFNEAAIGSYQNTLAETATGINAQVTAMTKLTASGVPLAAASEMVQDKTLAIAIAAAATEEEIWALKNAFDAVTEAEKNFANATPEGRQQTLESVISEANAYFAAQETMYNQQYEAAVKAYEDANDITQAQRDLADREFALDDLQFALNSIAEQESKINEEYDKRQEAIENVFKANKAILDQDKERLDIAGSLASGDLAAAAKAMRAQTTANLERNKEQQLENLQRSRELEIAQVRDSSGKSRLELEEAILVVEKEIAEIQENKLEPYQREVDLLGRIRDDALADVQAEGFLGKTQAAWAAIANEVDRARLNVDGYQDSLRDKLAGMPGIAIDENGNITVDAEQLVTPEVSPEPTVVTEGDTAVTDGDTAKPLEGSIAEVNPNQAEIDELNRLRQISRQKFQESDDEAYKKRLYDLNIQRGNRIKELGGIPMAMGGIVKYLRMGGLLPYKSEGGSIFESIGTDTVPAMLTPGEFVVRRSAVSNFGVDRLNAINTGTYSGESVYNYSVNVNVKSDANPEEIARSVMTQIKRIDSQRIRSNNY